MLIDTLVLQQYSYIYKKLLNQTNLFKLSKREKKEKQIPKIRSRSPFIFS